MQIGLSMQETVTKNADRPHIALVTRFELEKRYVSILGD
jgi:hypothetical protein